MFLPLHDKNPLQILPFQFVTCAIILTTIAAFFYQASLTAPSQQSLTASFGLIPAVLFNERTLPPHLAVLPAEITLITSMFLHGGWTHLIGNMAFLWVFGDNIEDSMGHFRFSAFYLLCGLAAGLTHAVAENSSLNPMIGASGAVSGVMAAYFVLHPKVKIIALVFKFIPVRLPAHLLIGVWLGLQILAVQQGSPGNVAWWAHIGGFCAGAALIPFMKRDSLPLLDQGVEH